MPTRNSRGLLAHRLPQGEGCQHLDFRAIGQRHAVFQHQRVPDDCGLHSHTLNLIRPLIDPLGGEVETTALETKLWLPRA